MRCARCNRPALPQATGQTPDGRVVFGWCLDCLAETECINIQAAGHRRGRKRFARRPQTVGRPSAAELRRRSVGRISVGLGLWALVLCGGGAGLLALRGPEPASPLGNGTPTLLLVGGGMTGLTSVLLRAAAGFPVFSSGATLRALHWGGIGTALALLLVGAARPIPRGNSLLIGVACLALALSAVASGIERRKGRSAWAANPKRAANFPKNRRN